MAIRYLESKGMKNICIAGGNGLIGRRLSTYLSACGYNIRWLIRKKDPSVSYKQFLWEPDLGTVDYRALEDLYCLINLTGSSIAGFRWTRKKKDSILQSRLHSIEVLCKMLRHQKLHIPHIIQSSAVGYYGHQANRVLDESHAVGDRGFLSEVCHQWEQMAQSFNDFTDKLTIVRTGLYLDPGGGLWPKLLLTKPLRLLNYFGTGEQIYSWLHYQDYCDAVEFIINNDIGGPVNLCSPGASSMKELMSSIQKQLKLKTFLLPVPSVVLYAILGESAHLVLDSTHAFPAILKEKGFQFKYPVIEDSIAQLIHDSK